MSDNYIEPSQKNIKRRRRKKRNWSRSRKRLKTQESGEKSTFGSETSFDTTFLESDDKLCNSAQKDEQIPPNPNALYLNQCSDEDSDIFLDFDIFTQEKLMEQTDRKAIVTAENRNNPLKVVHEFIPAEDIESSDSTPGRSPVQRVISESARIARSSEDLFEADDDDVVTELRQGNLKLSLWDSPLRSIKTPKLSRILAKNEETIHDSPTVQGILEDFNNIDGGVVNSPCKVTRYTEDLSSKTPSPEFVMNRAPLRTYSRHQAEKRKLKLVRNLDNHYEDSDSSLLSELSNQENYLNDLELTSNNVSLDKSIKMSENLLNLSSFFSQPISDEDDDPLVEGVYRYIQKLRRKDKCVQMIEWFRSGKNFEFARDSRSQDFEGFSDCKDSSFSSENSSVNLETIFDDEEDEILNNVRATCLESHLEKPSVMLPECHVEDVAGSGTIRDETSACFTQFERNKNKAEASLSSVEDDKAAPSVNNNSGSLAKKIEIPETANMLATGKMNQGFKLASGKSIIVSETALLKANQLFSEAENSNDIDLLKPSVSENITKKDNSVENYNKSSTKSNNPESISKIKVPSSESIRISKEHDPMINNKNYFGSRLLNNSTLDCKISSVGFKCASGKNINITADACRQANQFLFDFNNSESNEFKEINTVKNDFGFKSASGKEITISEEAKLKAEKFLANLDENVPKFEFIDNEEDILKAFGNCNDMAKHITKKEYSNESKAKTGNDSNSAISFASNLQNPANEIVPSEKTKPLCLKNVSMLSLNSMVSGFKCASGKEIKVSEEAKLKAEKFLADLDENVPKFELIDNEEDILKAFGNCDDITKQISKKESSNESNVNTGNERYDNSAISFTSKFQSPANEIFLSETTKPICLKNISIMNINGMESGFKCASGKEIKVSEEAKLKAEKFLADLDENVMEFELINSSKKQESHSCITLKQISATMPFNNSGDRLKPEEQILQPSNKVATNPENHHLIQKSLKASDKFIVNATQNILEGSYLKKSKLLPNFNEPKICVDEMKNMDAFTENIGFKSASGKEIKISDEAKIKTEKFLVELNKDLIESDIISITGNKPDLMPTFENSNNAPNEIIKNISVKNSRKNRTSTESKRVLRSSKRISSKSETKLENCDLENNFNKNENIWSNNFTSASGKSINISDVALVNAKKFFNKLEPVNCDKQYEELLTTTSKTVLPLIETVKHQCNQNTLIPKNNDKNISSSPLESVISPAEYIRQTNVSKGSLSLSLKPKTKNEKMEFKTPLKTKSINCNHETPNMLDFFKSVSTSTPLANRRKQTFSLTQEVTASTEAILEDEFKDSSFTKDLESICWDDFDDSLKESSTYNQIQVSNASQSSLVKVNVSAVSNNIKTLRHLSRQKQLKVIKNKINKKGKISPGILYQEKSKPNRLRLTEFIQSEQPRLYSPEELMKLGIRKDILDVNFQTAADFRFNLNRFYPDQINIVDGIQMGDNALVIPDDFNSAGINEIEKAFLTIEEVSSLLIPDQWISHHFKMILLKLSYLEKTFPHTFGNKICTPENLLLQLKYRYDHEIDLAHRSALKKIIECDESPAKRMILLVLDIQRSNAGIELELSDRWYSIRTLVDMAMCRLIEAGKVNVGTKLMIQNAELIGAGDGLNPINMPPDVKLKIHTNSTKRAKWNFKLGLYNILKPFPIKLDEIKEDGGIVTKLNLIVLRVYPSIYLNQNDKERATFYSEKVEMQFRKIEEQRNFENVERIFSQVLEEVEGEIRPKRSSNRQRWKCVKDIKDDEQLQDLIEQGFDFDETELTPTQRQLLERCKQNLFAKKMEEIHNRAESRLVKESKKRKSIEILKIRVIDAKNPKNSAILSIWKPSENLRSMFQEGINFQVTNCMANGMRYGYMQLNAMNQTEYNFGYKKQIPVELARKLFIPKEVCSAQFKPEFNELDLVGFVILIDIYEPKKFQSVYICDNEENVLCIKFWGGLKEYAYDEVIQINKFIAASNLQWRTNSGIETIKCTFATEISTFTETPKTEEIKMYLNNLKSNFNTKDIKEYSEIMLGKIYDLKKQPKKNENLMSTPVRNVKNLSSVSTPLNSMESRNMSSISLHGENSLITSPQVRIDQLQLYGTPPPISTLTVNKCKASVRKGFKLPRKLSDVHENNR